MKNAYLLSITFAISFLILRCDSNNIFLSRSNLKLTAPNGVKIANSVKDLENVVRSLMQDEIGITEIITITRINYKSWNSINKENVIVTVYYKTSKGKQDHFDIEGGRL